MRVFVIILIIILASVIISVGVLLFTLSKGQNKGQDSLRLKCTSCKHCKKKQNQAHGSKTYAATYCFLLKKPLKADSRCIIREKDKAYYEAGTVESK